MVEPMEANFKLEEASYFLGRLKELVNTPAMPSNMQEIDNKFMYTSSAFLTAWRSVLDILLYDYVERYFGISREEKLDTDAFKIAAIACKKQEAIEFITWYRKQLGILTQNPLWKKRNVIVHRTRPSISREYRLYLTETIALADSTKVVVPSTALTGSLTSAVSPEKMENRPNVVPTGDPIMKFTYFFVDIKDKEVPVICEEALEQMKKIVEEASNSF